MNTNKSIYWVIGIIIFGIFAFGGYKLWHHTITVQESIQHTSSINPPTTVVPSQTQSASGLSNKTDTSNQQLDQDLQSVQNSMNQLQQDQNTTNNDLNTASQNTPQE